MTSDLRECANADEVARRAAAAVSDATSDAVRRCGRCSLVLSGGNTPRALYQLLASEFRDRIPWTGVHVFWGDERYVPAQHPGSNYRMARELLLDHVPCPPRNVHPMPTGLVSPDAAAREYEGTLRAYFGDDPPRFFDLVLLGLGEDGHTASLFPGSWAIEEPTRWVVAVTAPAAPPTRLTLTLAVLNRAATIYVLVAGASKARALHHVLSGSADPTVYPAAGLRSAEASVTWWVDRAAATAPRDADADIDATS